MNDKPDDQYELMHQNALTEVKNRMQEYIDENDFDSTKEMANVHLGQWVRKYLPFIANGIVDDKLYEMAFNLVVGDIDDFMRFESYQFPYIYASHIFVGMWRKAIKPLRIVDRTMSKALAYVFNKKFVTVEEKAAEYATMKSFYENKNIKYPFTDDKNTTYYCKVITLYIRSKVVK